MIDLLGDPITPAPAMDAPLPWRVFCLSDCDWWVARTLDEAKADYLESVGPMREDDAFEDPYELTDDQLASMQFMDLDEDEHRLGKHSFRIELDRRIAAGLSKPEMFATTEY